MRIISGAKKGQKLKIKAGSRIRPTSGRVRQAVFNILPLCLEEVRVLDLYSGTGAMAMEALSRGALSAVMVDAGRDAINFIHDNLAALNLAERGRVMPKKALSALNLLSAEDARFDLVFIDPPYQSGETEKVLEKLARSGLLNPGALVVVEHDTKGRLAESYGALVLTDQRTYGRTEVLFYEQKETPE